MRDDRAARGVAKVLRGEIITDQDLFTPDELRRAPYFNECIYAVGLRWFAGIGFWAGSACWALSLQRTAQDGPFEPEDKRLLAELSPRLGEAATLSTAVGRSVLASMTNALNLVRRPALVLDRMGVVLDWNSAAEGLFDDAIRVVNRRLMLAGRAARAALGQLLDRMRATPDAGSLPAVPIVVQREGKRPVLIRVLPIPGAAKSPFLGARVLLTFADLGPKPGPDPRLLASLFGLTAAEARLASRIAAGAALDDIAVQLGISRETARNQLKAVFAKTETHRQAELVALLSQLPAALGQE